MGRPTSSARSNHNASCSVTRTTRDAGRCARSGQRRLPTISAPISKERMSSRTLFVRRRTSDSRRASRWPGISARRCRRVRAMRSAALRAKNRTAPAVSANAHSKSGCSGLDRNAGKPVDVHAASPRPETAGRSKWHAAAGPQRRAVAQENPPGTTLADPVYRCLPQPIRRVVMDKVRTLLDRRVFRQFERGRTQGATHAGGRAAFDGPRCGAVGCAGFVDRGGTEAVCKSRLTAGTPTVLRV